MKKWLKYLAGVLLLVLLPATLYMVQNADAAGKITISRKSLTITEGKSKTLTVKNVKKGKKIVWSSTNKQIASVNKNGKVTAKKQGRAVIKAKAGKAVASCKVMVKGKRKDTKETISIHVGNDTFQIKLYDNQTASSFLERLPMTITMEELNNNEKYYYMEEPLPSAPQAAGSIHRGDLMLYGTDCLVLFYEDFDTSYSYTKLGYIEDAKGLKDALGPNSAEVTFSK